MEPQNLKSVFNEALDRPAGPERSAYLDEACRDNPDLRAQVDGVVERPRPGRPLPRDLGGRPRTGSLRERPVRARRPGCGGSTVDPANHRRSRHAHRSLQAAPEDRRRGHGRRLHGRAGKARPSQGRSQDHQAGDGYRPGDRALRGRATGARLDGSPQYRSGPRRRHNRLGPPLLRHGPGQGRPDHRILRPQSTLNQRTARTVRTGLPGHSTRPSKGPHPPRHQALECAGDPRRRQAGAEGDRLRRGQGDRPATDRKDDVHSVRDGRGHARIHEPRAGRDGSARRRHPVRHLLAGRPPLRTLDGFDAAGQEQAARGGLHRNPPQDPRGRAPRRRALG